MVVTAFGTIGSHTEAMQNASEALSLLRDATIFPSKDEPHSPHMRLLQAASVFPGKEGTRELKSSGESSTADSSEMEMRLPLGVKLHDVKQSNIVGASIPQFREGYRYYRLLILAPILYVSFALSIGYCQVGEGMLRAMAAFWQQAPISVRVFFVLGYLSLTPARWLSSALFAIWGYSDAERRWALRDDQQRPSEFACHVVVVPAYKEPYSVLARTLASLPGRFDEEDDPVNFELHVVMALEVLDPTRDEVFSQLEEEFRGRFASFSKTEHQLLPGEQAGKASNENYAMRQILERFEAMGVDPWKMMVTICDADSCFACDFFFQLEEAYRSQIDGRRQIYSAPRNTYRNFAEVVNPMIAAAEVGMNAADLCTDLTKPYGNFSNYSLLLGYAAELDFWNPEVIAEDFHILYRAMICSRGARNVVRVWSVIANDSVVRLRDRYQQALRHMWGITTGAWLMAVLRNSRFSVDRIWFELIQFYMEEVSGVLMPMWIMFLALFAGGSRMLEVEEVWTIVHLYGTLSIVQGFITWLIICFTEVFVWRNVMNKVPDVDMPSTCQFVVNFVLMPFTMPLSAMFFGTIASWQCACSAFWRGSEFAYITAPKA